MTLKENHYSNFSKGKERILYAPKGAEVNLISEHGDVLIVEYKNNKFSIRKEDATDGCKLAKARI